MLGHQEMMKSELQRLWEYSPPSIIDPALEATNKKNLPKTFSIPGPVHPQYSTYVLVTARTSYEKNAGERKRVCDASAGVWW